MYICMRIWVVIVLRRMTDNIFHSIGLYVILES